MPAQQRTTQCARIDRCRNDITPPGHLRAIFSRRLRLPVCVRLRSTQVRRTTLTTNRFARRSCWGWLGGYGAAVNNTLERRKILDGGRRAHSTAGGEDVGRNSETFKGHRTSKMQTCSKRTKTVFVRLTENETRAIEKQRAYDVTVGIKHICLRSRYYKTKRALLCLTETNRFYAFIEFNPCRAHFVQRALSARTLNSMYQGWSQL